MSADHDVAARLAEGQPAVDDFTEYVLACQQVGAQRGSVALVDRYASEEGMDLGALDADILTMTELANAVDDAVRQQVDVVSAMAGSWGGAGAGAALDFLHRHQRASVAVAMALRDAAGTLTTLRAELVRAVDGKVDATLAIAERAGDRRAAWLAAARTLATGSGDRSTATELIDQQVKPFVDNDIRVEWDASMRAGTASVIAAYDGAVARLRACPHRIFEIPGALGPERNAPVAQQATGGVLSASAGVVPAVVASVSPLPSAAMSQAPVQAPAPVVSPAGFAEPTTIGQPAPPAAPPTDLGGAVPGVGGAVPDLGGAMPGVGGMGLSGLGQQLSDLIGGLVGGVADAAPELSDVGPESDALDDPADDDPDDDPDDDDDPDAEPDDDADPEADGDGEDPEGETVESTVEVADDPPADDVPPEPVLTPVGSEPEPPPGPVEPMGPEEPEPATQPKTPCEIAADELPQVGPQVQAGGG